MNIPKGYKQTELGIIPEDWEVRKICEGLADVKSGKRLPMGYYVTENRTNHPYIRVIDMYDGGVNISNLMYVPNEAYKSIEKYRIFKDDIFISVAGTLGIVGKIPKWLDGANLTENANRLTNITCDRDYLLYYLRSPYIQNVISSEQTIGAQPKLALTRIRNFDIALPGNIREQKAIAKALSDVDDLIAALDKKIAKKRLVKQGAMQQLLTGKKRLPGFTEEWVDAEVAEICEILDNRRIPLNEEQRKKGVYPYCGANGVVDYIDKYIFNDDLILIAEDGGNFDQFETRPIAYWMTGKFWVNNHAHVLKASSEYCQKFIYYQLEHKDITDYIVGGTRTKLTRAQLNCIEIKLPIAKKEQQTIATILSDMDKEITDLETKRDKYRLLKLGMMQKLLTGQIRLNTK